LTGSVWNTTNNVGITGSFDINGTTTITGSLNVTGSGQYDINLNGQMLVTNMDTNVIRAPRILVSGSGGNVNIQRNSIVITNTTQSGSVRNDTYGFSNFNPNTTDYIGMTVNSTGAAASGWTAQSIYVNDPTDSFPAMIGFQNKSTWTDGRITLLRNTDISGSIKQTIGFIGTGNNTAVTNSFIGNTEITGSGTGTNALRVSGSGQFTRTLTVGRSSSTVGGTITAQGINPYVIVASVTSSASNTGLGYLSMVNQNSTSTNEFLIGISETQTNFNDYNGFGYVSFLKIDKNTGNNPIPQFVRGLNVTGSLVVTGSIYNRGNGNVINNLAYGQEALFNMSSSATNNVGFGYQALYYTTIGGSNTAIGANSMLNNVSGSQNLAIGDNSLRDNAGSGNVAIGSFSMFRNTTGTNNLAIGRNSLYNNTTATLNTAIGYNTLYNTTTGGGNTAVGATALQSLSVGTDNIAFGYDSQFANESGSNNISIGNSGLISNVNGSRNISIGNSAGRFETGSDTFYLDNQNRGNLNASRSGSLLYGTFNGTAANQTLQINASTTVTNNLTVASGSDFFAHGHKQFNTAEFWSTQIQSGSAGVSGSLTFNNSGSLHGISLVSGSRMTVANAGTYNIQFSAQIETSAGADTGYIWYKKNGTNIADSATKVLLANNTAQVMTVNLIDEASANDYYELGYQFTNGNATILYEAASGNIPVVPSVIATLTQVR